MPEDELENKNEYWKLIYQYSKLKDPKEMNAEEIEEVRNYAVDVVKFSLIAFAAASLCSFLIFCMLQNPR